MRTKRLPARLFDGPFLTSASEWPLFFAPLLVVHDLITAGIASGSQFGEILVTVEDAQLERTVFDRDAAARFVREQYGNRKPWCMNRCLLFQQFTYVPLAMDNSLNLKRACVGPNPSVTIAVGQLCG